MTDTDRMVVWLREALDTAQADAEAATPGPWRVRPEPDAGENWEIATTGRDQRWVIGAEGGGGVYDKPDADHIARHDPAAVLRRIAADRKTLDECVAAFDWDNWGAASLAETAIRNLAEGWGWTEEGQ